MVDLTKITNCMSAGSAVVATGVGWWTAVTWLSHRRKANQYAVARRLLKDTLILRDTVRYCRNPCSSDAIRDPTRRPSRHRRSRVPASDNVTWQTVSAERRDRLWSYNVAYRAVEASLVEAEAVFIPVGNLKTMLAEFLTLGTEFQGGLGAYEALNADRDRGVPSTEASEAELRQGMATMNDWSLRGKPDDFEQRLTALADRFIDQLRPYLGMTSRRR